MSEQLRVVRRLLVHFLATLAPLADKVLLVGRTWFQVPSTDGGSAWFTNRKGVSSMSPIRPGAQGDPVETAAYYAVSEA